MRCCENKTKNKILYMALAITIIFGIYYGQKTSLKDKTTNQSVESEVETKNEINKIK